MPPFVIFGLPRSRTFWLSRFLTYGEWTCGHEEIRHARSLDDFHSWLRQSCTGTAETAGASWWRLIERYAPDCRVVVVRRPRPAVVDSLMTLNVGIDRAWLNVAMDRLDKKLDQIERRIPRALSIRFADLETEATCATVFEHCLPYRHNPDWWRMLAPMNLQIDMRALIRYFQACEPQLAKLTATAKHHVIAGMMRPVEAPDGVTIQQEPFETFLRDGEALFDEHLVQVGEPPGNWREKNIPLMRVMEDLGAMQITTARSNGRMFGYLMAIISPSLESPHVTSAMHTLFYASPEFPGLGMKLQRASISALRARDVGELFLRAGTRGAGPKLGSLYRRLGAEDFGQLYKLELKAA